MEKRSIVTDPPSLAVPNPSFWDMHSLNYQTAFNRRTIERAGNCGCFHCGSTFEYQDIIEWIEEEDGEDTALCPYCGIDAVITGNSSFPLSTALLGMLYIEWYSEEFEERESNAFSIPSSSDKDDYYRRGIPFAFENVFDKDTICEIELFPSEWGNGVEIGFYPGEEFTSELRTGIYEVATRPIDEDDCIVRFVSESGKLLSYEPWTGDMEDRILGLIEESDTVLYGIITFPGSRKMRLFFGDDCRI